MQRMHAFLFLPDITAKNAWKLYNARSSCASLINCTIVPARLKSAMNKEIIFKNERENLLADLPVTISVPTHFDRHRINEQEICKRSNAYLWITIERRCQCREIRSTFWKIRFVCFVFYFQTILHKPGAANALCNNSCFWNKNKTKIIIKKSFLNEMKTVPEVEPSWAFDSRVASSCRRRLSAQTHSTTTPRETISNALTKYSSNITKIERYWIACIFRSSDSRIECAQSKHNGRVH